MSDLVQLLRAMADGAHDDMSLAAEAAAELERLQAEVERLRKDAERYQIWREAFCCANGDEIHPLLFALGDAWSATEVDAAIDAAMQQEPR